MNNTFNDYDAVKALVDLYVEGIRDGNTAKLTQAFHPRAFVMGHGEKLGFKGHFEIDKYIAIFKDNPHMAGPNYAAQVKGINITGDAGVVILEETDFHGCNFVNYLSISRLEGAWCITNKTYSTVGVADQATQ